MLFANAIRNSVLTLRTRSTSAQPAVSNALRNPPRSRLLSTGVSVEEASGGVVALLVAVGTTFGTYMIADFLSNFLQHPTQKVCVECDNRRDKGALKAKDAHI